MNIKEYIRDIKDFPQEGILFRDITPLLHNGEAFSYVINQIVEYAKAKNVNVIVGPESRGFIFGCPVATNLGIGFVPIRKPGKLPYEQVTVDYSLEYGKNTLCMHKDAINPGDNVLIVDDLLATGGTTKAACSLVEKLGGNVVGIACVIELKDLEGRKEVSGYDVFTQIVY